MASKIDNFLDKLYQNHERSYIECEEERDEGAMSQQNLCFRMDLCMQEKLRVNMRHDEMRQ